MHAYTTYACTPYLITISKGAYYEACHGSPRKTNEKIVLNPGSVGVPLNSNGKTQFLILHGTNGTWQHEFLSLDYDVERVISDLYKEKSYIKAPFWCTITENLLCTGKGAHGTVLMRAMELYGEDYGVCNWPNIPETCCEQAVKELIG